MYPLYIGGQWGLRRKFLTEIPRLAENVNVQKPWHLIVGKGQARLACCGDAGNASLTHMWLPVPSRGLDCEGRHQAASELR